MTLKHTPGPWETDYAFIYANPDSELPDNANQGACLVIAKVLDHSTKRPLANARLISAAPDLLAALQSLLEVAGYLGIHESPYTDVASNARLAIRKATGE